MKSINQVQFIYSDGGFTDTLQITLHPDFYVTFSWNSEGRVCSELTYEAMQYVMVVLEAVNRHLPDNLARWMMAETETAHIPFQTHNQSHPGEFTVLHPDWLQMLALHFTTSSCPADGEAISKQTRKYRVDPQDTSHLPGPEMNRVLRLGVEHIATSSAKILDEVDADDMAERLAMAATDEERTV